MNNRTEIIQQISHRLLTEGRVDKVIGFRNGSLPMMTMPCAIRKPADASRLIWNAHCRLNLTQFLEGTPERIAITLKGCDSRNLVTHLAENRVQRENVVIIGVPCTGMIDKWKIEALVGEEITEVSETEGNVTVKTKTMEKVLPFTEVVQDNCAQCQHRNPVIVDEPVGDPVEERQSADQYAAIRAVEAMGPQERWRYFEEMLAPCTRCYACRNACPLCYCPTCFVDESRPQWVGKGMNPVDIRVYHMLRAFHTAGRCTDCGACEAACPMHIPVRLLTGKLRKDCFDHFGWTAGLSPDRRPALDVYSPNDPNEFFK
jgi:formate dehydrogenase (coenzyme F420) beta subunit